MIQCPIRSCRVCVSEGVWKTQLWFITDFGRKNSLRFSSAGVFSIMILLFLYLFDALLYASSYLSFFLRLWKRIFKDIGKEMFLPFFFPTSISNTLPPRIFLLCGFSFLSENNMSWWDLLILYRFVWTLESSPQLFSVLLICSYYLNRKSVRDRLLCELSFS